VHDAAPEVMDVDRLDPADFHTAGWRAAHWDGVPYGVPARPRPSFCSTERTGSREEGLAPPATTDGVIARRHFHDPRRGRYGMAWNAARGTALGHTFMMTCADFGQPMLDLPENGRRLRGRPLGSRDLCRRPSTPTGRWRRPNT
jgi:multiple sugar transport system substrate-binding protein